MVSLRLFSSSLFILLYDSHVLAGEHIVRQVEDWAVAGDATKWKEVSDALATEYGLFAADGKMLPWAKSFLE